MVSSHHYLPSCCGVERKNFLRFFCLLKPHEWVDFSKEPTTTIVVIAQNGWKSQAVESSTKGKQQQQWVSGGFLMRSEFALLSSRSNYTNLTRRISDETWNENLKK
jgi:hypothetical protein